ncbi:MAG: hypothetical protein Q9218_007344 [Villophora microphyllina]
MEQSSQDEAAKARIIKHMNADHQDSLVRYLEHFCHLSSFSARNAELERVTLDSLSISVNKAQTYPVPIQPPMTSWSEARSRFAALDGEAVKSLGRSSTTVKEYRRPRGFLAIVFALVVMTYTLFNRRANFLPGSLVYDTVLQHAKPFAKICFAIQPWLFYPMVLLHAVETINFDRTRLQKHSVSRFTSLWWKWVMSCFIEGVGSYMRFDTVVKEEEEKKAKAKH